jgi:CAAX protease family protein
MKVKVRVRNMSSTALLNLPPLRRGGLADPLRALREHPLLAFFILAFAFTWVIEIPMQVWRIAPMQLLVGYMPGLAALLVAGAIGGRSGIRTVLRTLLIWRVGVQWYAVALFGFLVVWFGTQALNPLFGGTGIHLPTLSLALVAAFIAELVLRMLLSSEQLAWSGFALPRLQARHSALVASLVLGVIWAIWHLPLFLVPGSQADAAFGIFLVGTVCTRIVLTWVFNNTGGGVLLCGLLHQSINVWTDILGPSAAASPADQPVNQWLGLGLNLSIVVLLIVVFGGRHLSRHTSARVSAALDPAIPAAAAVAP